VNPVATNNVVTVNQASPVVEKVRVAGNYPTIETVNRKVEQMRPSAPPVVMVEDRRVRVAEDDRDERRKERSTPKGDRTTKRDKKTDDVRRIRDAEARNDASAAATRKRVNETVARRKKGESKERKGSQPTAKNYPTSATWRPRSESWSLISCMQVGWFLTVLSLTITAWLYRTVHFPEVTEVTSTSFTYKGTTFNSTSTEAYNNAGTLTALPALVQELLAFPNAPTLDCGNGTLDDFNAQNRLATLYPQNFTHMWYGNLTDRLNWDAGITTNNPGRVPGGYCTGSQLSIGYCVRVDTCPIVAYSNQMKYCADSDPNLGGVRVGDKFIPASFFELIPGNWLLAVVPLAIAFVLGILWLIIVLATPTLAPLSLYLIGLGACVAVYFGNTFGLGEVVSNNYYILVYAGFVGLFVIGTWTYQSRAGRVFRLGIGFLTGELNEEYPHANAANMMRPIIGFIGIHAVGAILLLLFAGPAQHVLYFTFSDEYYAFVQSRNKRDFTAWLNPVQMVLEDEEFEKFLETFTGYCKFGEIVKFSVAIAVIAVFYMFFAINMQYGTRCLVASGTADGYFYGTRRYQAPPGGQAEKGVLSFHRAFASSGYNILRAGFWAYVGATSASLLGGFFNLMLHIIVSPVEALGYSFMGLMFTGFSGFENRFTLIHGSMLPGDVRQPNYSNCQRLAHVLVSKTYGRAQAKLGDAPELNLICLSGNLVAVGCGLVTWVWTDYIQGSDSIASFGWYVFLILWLVGSALQRPAILAVISIIYETFSASLLPAWRDQAAKNSMMGFIITAALSGTILKAFMEVPAAALDTVVYCYAIERSKRRKIRSLKIEELMHKDYLNDQGTAPPGTQLERAIVACPLNAKPNDLVTIEVEGRQFEVKIPPGAIPGKDFEVAVAVPVNVLDIEEEEEEDFEWGSDDSEDAGVVRNEDDEEEMVEAPKMVLPRQLDTAGKRVASPAAPVDPAATQYQY
jgi:hypothetical protein